MLKTLEYHIISQIIFAIHLRLFICNVFCVPWKWDIVHIYFCVIVAYISCLVVYATHIYLNFHNFDLKNYPPDKIQSTKNNSKKKNIHPYVSFERKDLVEMKYYKLLYGIIFCAPWKIVALSFLVIVNICTC
ncbi:phospholipid or glycerol acyltransferase, putative, partial [Hepatocystis sp. ex Piliocolobus tephrosceles]